MAIKSALYGLVGATALLTLSTSTAVAGCGGVGNCDTGSVHTASPYAPDYGPVTVRSGTPYDYMSSIRFQRAPNVQVTRVHGQGPVPSLSDAPHGSVGGCFDHASGYCYGDAGRPVSVEFDAAPQLPAPVFQAPAPAPVFQAPVMAAPVQPDRLVAVGGGYDPSKFAPRIYGDLSVTPGIAHVPTSIVDRDPARAQAVLDQIAPGSVTPALAGVPIRHGVPYAAPYRLDPVPGALAADLPPRGVNLPGGVHGHAVPTPVMAQPGMAQPPMTQPSMAQPFVQPQPFAHAQPFAQPPVQFGVQRPALAGAPIPQADGTYASQVASDGTYWEKVSGVTKMGNTVATSVVCKRALPVQTVNPTVGVPYPVPVAVPVDGCAPAEHAAHAPRGRY